MNSAFFYDFDVNDEGKLMRVFWADATGRKNYTLLEFSRMPGVMLFVEC